MGRWAGVVAVVLVGCGGDDDGLEYEADTGVYVSDGDVPSLAPPGVAEQPLTVAVTRDGSDDVWPAQDRGRLTYCIDAEAFGRDATAVTRAMREATGDWEAAAGVRFSSVVTASCTAKNERVMFNVRPVKGRRYLARAFFPSHPRAAREVLINGTALPPRRPWTLAGVLRHELGHVLGLRHEHTRQRGNRCFEDAQWRAVTPYDARSVMHYPQCAGSNDDGDLVLTARDKQGIAALYPRGR